MSTQRLYPTGPSINPAVTFAERIHRSVDETPAAVDHRDR
jgi:hypothetical protein